MERGLQPKIRDCGSRSAAHAGGAVRAADAGGPAVPEGEGISTLQTPALGQCYGAEWCGQVSTWIKDESTSLQCHFQSEISSIMANFGISHRFVSLPLFFVTV